MTKPTTNPAAIYVVTGYSQADLDDLDSLVYLALNTGAVFRSLNEAKTYVNDDAASYFMDDDVEVQWRTVSDDVEEACVGTFDEPEAMWRITRVSLPA